MPPTALGLVLVAAGLHAGWNLLVKRAREKQVFTWWALLVGAIGFAPLVVMGWPLPIYIWPYVVCSALVEAAYFITLTRAYEDGDFSLVYPIARGSAPAFLTLWAVIFLGDRPRPVGLVGIALLVLGLIVVGGKSWWSLKKTSVLTSNALGLALLTALFISIYSAIDGAAVHRVDPLPYTVLVIGLSAVFVAPVVLVRYGGHGTLAEWRANWFRIVLVGILSLLSYMLVLQAYSIAHVSYAGAIREISVVFAAFLGWRLLGEDFGMIRLIGAILIFVGIVVIALAG
jgi:drug/metabolite transporter (DMT)-like permease